MRTVLFPISSFRDQPERWKQRASGSAENRASVVAGNAARCDLDERISSQECRGFRRDGPSVAAGQLSLPEITFQCGTHQPHGASFFGQRSTARCADLFPSRNGTDPAVSQVDHVQLRSRCRPRGCHAICRSDILFQRLTAMPRVRRGL